MGMTPKAAMSMQVVQSTRSLRMTNIYEPDFHGKKNDVVQNRKIIFKCTCANP